MTASKAHPTEEAELTTLAVTERLVTVTGAAGEDQSRVAGWDALTTTERQVAGLGSRAANPSC